METIKFKKLFGYVNTEGMFTNAIVTYVNYPYKFYTSGHTQYDRRLIIDLWIITICIRWTSRKIK